MYFPQQDYKSRPYRRTHRVHGTMPAQYRRGAMYNPVREIHTQYRRGAIYNPVRENTCLVRGYCPRCYKSRPTQHHVTSRHAFSQRDGATHGIINPPYPTSRHAFSQHYQESAIMITTRPTIYCRSHYCKIKREFLQSCIQNVSPTHL
jgi:hypothetical protein